MWRRLSIQLLLVLTIAPVGAAYAEEQPALAGMPRTAAPRSDASTRRPTLLPYLYTSNAVLQAYDAFGTVTLVKEGYREMNPFMREMAEHPPAYAALKAGVTLGSMAISERLWKSNHRTAAVATMLLINSTMALVAVNNTRHLQNR